MNTTAFFQAYVFITLVFSGTAQYFTQVQAFLWLPFIMTMVMTALLPLLTRYNFQPIDRVETSILILYVGFMLLALFPSFLQVGIKETVAGIKNCLGISLLLPCLFLGFCRESQLYRVCQKLYWVFYAQIPLALYQFLVVVPARVAAQGPMDKFDSVVGTFGGSMTAGGNGASMGLFCLLVMLMKVSEFKNGVATLRSTIVHVVIGLGLCVISEVKFAILLAPIFFLYVYVSPSYIKEIRVISTKTILLLVLGATLLLLTIIVVSSLTYATQYQANMGVLDIFLENTSYIFDTSLIVAGLDGKFDELGRLTALVFWGQHSGSQGLGSQLFGYGLNSSNAGSIIPGYIAKYFSLALGSTALAIFLWEIGLIGTILLMLIIYLVLKNTKVKPLFSKEDLSEADIKLLSYQTSFRAFIIVGLITLPYSPLLALIPVFQFPFYFSLGSMLLIRKATLTKLETYNA